MLAFVYNILFFLASAGAHDEGGFMGFYNKYLNFPGFEAWKFLNLAIFVGVLTYILKKPLSEAFKAKRENIRAELIKAEEEKQAALAKLTAAEAKLVEVENEKAAIIERAKAEAEAERARLAGETSSEVKKLYDQATGEISRLAQNTRAELRKFSAEESVKLAEEKLRSRINADTDSRLIKAGIDSIGGLN
jgi:F-type H+-transporting ATPase subunit b